MDGLKERLNSSIQSKLSLTLTLAILVVAIVAGGVSFAMAFSDAHELQDETLNQAAKLVQRQPANTIDATFQRESSANEEDARVIVQRLAPSGQDQTRTSTSGSLAFPNNLANGFHTLDVGDVSYRVLIETTFQNEQIAVAQRTDIRDEIAFNSALRTALPLLVLVPILLVIVASIVHKMIRPITELSREIDQRGESDLHPIDEAGIPVEVRSFVRAINHQFVRVLQSLETQRRFVADAAHELRSPVTALLLQAERLEATEMSEAARERLLMLRQGIERNRRLLEQLLALASVQDTHDITSSALSVQAVFRRVIEDLMPLAEDKGIDLGVEGDRDAALQINEFDLVTMVKNLTDNAIRYTPNGGRVDLMVEQTIDRVIVRVQDTGPGIPVAERARIFDPFYRVFGSEQVGTGLGLSIVQTIASRMNATIQTDYADARHQKGWVVTVSIPR